MPIKKKIVITGLVNNAGVRFRKTLLQFQKDLTKVMDTNFLSIFLLCKNFQNIF